MVYLLWRKIINTPYVVGNHCIYNDYDLVCVFDTEDDADTYMCHVSARDADSYILEESRLPVINLPMRNLYHK